VETILAPTEDVQRQIDFRRGAPERGRHRAAALRSRIHVMPGLVLGIPVVKRRVDIRTSTYLSAAGGAVVLNLRCAPQRGWPEQVRP
jgi:hypothetical protein